MIRTMLLAGAAIFALTTTASAQEAKLQSMLLRSVTVTCKLEESIAFYNDLGFGLAYRHSELKHFLQHFRKLLLH